MPRELKEHPRYYEFKFFLDQVVEVTDDEITLYTRVVGSDCIRPIRDGDGIKLPDDVEIIEFDDHAMISGIGRADKVHPWLIFKCN